MRDQLKNYNSNIFPIPEFNFDNPSNEFSPNMLFLREKVINEFKKLPKIAGRNLKGDIRRERTSSQFDSTFRSIEYINQMLSQLSNRSDDIKEKMYRKIFSSDNTTFDSVARFLEEKENVIGGKDFTRENIMELVKKHGTPIVYDKKGVIILDIQSKSEMKEFGQNGLWCFTYGKEEDDNVFYNYSTNGHVYLIIDTKRKSDHPDFMYVLIKPIPKESFRDFFDQINHQQHFDFSYDVKTNNKDSDVLYDLTNQPVENPLHTIYTVVRGDLDVFNLFTFED